MTPDLKLKMSEPASKASKAQEKIILDSPLKQEPDSDCPVFPEYGLSPDS